MTAVDPAALRELAQGLTVPTIAEAPPQTIAIDVDGERAVRDIVDGRRVWEDALGFGWPDAAMEGARITHIPVPVEQLATVRAALEGAAAELEDLRDERNDFVAKVGIVMGERDRARDAAAALEAECAELRAGVLAARDRMVAEESEWTPEPGPEYCEIRQALTDLLARTDPLRAETESGESRG